MPIFERMAARTQPRRRFAVVRWGYATYEVDVLLDEIERGITVDNSELLDRVFTVTKNGYDRPTVHRYLASQVTDQSLVHHVRLHAEMLEPGRLAA